MVPAAALTIYADARAPRSGGGGPQGKVVAGGTTSCSPLRRGWSPSVSTLYTLTKVLPAQAGVVPLASSALASSSCAPRSGGGGPVAIGGSLFRYGCSPLRRGWSLSAALAIVFGGVLPAQAGVVPLQTLLREGRSGAPRSGGGGPTFLASVRVAPQCSPLRRGWSRLRVSDAHPRRVLPAQAGVVPQVALIVGDIYGAPRSGGGGPSTMNIALANAVCSPLRRGWSLSQWLHPARSAVLPAQAGVVPVTSAEAGMHPCAPRSGGGGPLPAIWRRRKHECSPLRRGWSRCGRMTYVEPPVLPAQAGVVPARTECG